MPRTPTTEPTPLRWGPTNALWGADDTVTVPLSGPNGEPYTLKIDPEQADALRETLARLPSEGDGTGDQLIPLDIPPCPDTCRCRRIGAAVPARHPWADQPNALTSDGEEV